MSHRLDTPCDAADWLRSRITGSLWADSRKVGRGDGFIAWPGAVTDAREYVAQVLAAGAGACLVEESGSQRYEFSDEKVATYRGLRTDAAAVAAAYFGNPSQHLQLVAVTGTNGKTSTAWWLAQALSRAGQRCGVVGTLGIGEPGNMVANGLTTPNPILLQQQLRQFVGQGFRACALEASSIGIAEHRLDACQVDVAIFTNFTQDHLDYHGSMASYWEAKQKLFAWPGLKAAVINVDDPKGAELASRLRGTGLDVWSISRGGTSRLSAGSVVQRATGLSFEVVESDSNAAKSVSATAPSFATANAFATVSVAGMVGLYNVTNLLGVLAALRALGIPLALAAAACQDVLPVPGRLETLAWEGQPLVVIDYAHTPDALEKVLTALRPVAQSRQGRLWCVFGCGGDRDPVKRPLMAAAAQENADFVVVTSDNPRHESPDHIINQILLGLSRSDAIHVEADRALAIAQTVASAHPADVVLIAGKGHESYQDMGGVKQPFSDQAHAQAALARRAGGVS